METQTRPQPSLRLTEDQAITVAAAINRAINHSRKQQLHFLEMHESPKVGPVFRAEAWQAFRKWERHESELVQAINDIEATYPGGLPFAAFSRFS
jgi:hypothetical protein